MKYKIEALMKEKDMTFQQFSSYFKVSKQTITKKLNGTLDWTYEEIMIIAKIFHIEDPMTFFYS